MIEKYIKSRQNPSGLELRGQILITDASHVSSSHTVSCMSQKSYRQMEQLRENSYGTVTDTPELLHASYLKDVYSQVSVCVSVCVREIRFRF